MARKLHQAIADENNTYAVIETTASSGGRKWGNYVNLSTVKVDNDMVDSLEGRRIIGNPLIEVIETWEVDSANQGPRSGYGKTLAAMLEELPGHVQGDVRYDTGVLAPDGSTKEFTPAIDQIQTVAALGKSPDQAALDAIGQADRKGSVQVSEGVYLHNQEDIISEQAQWKEHDQARGTDFIQAPYWLADDSGSAPVAIRGADSEDLRQVFKENTRVVLEQGNKKSTRATGSDEDLATPEQALAARQARYGRSM